MVRGFSKEQKQNMLEA